MENIDLHKLNYGTEALEKFDDSNNYFQWLYKQIDIYINDRIIEVGAGRGHLTDCYFDFSEAICLTEFDPNCYNFLKSKYQSIGKIDCMQVDLENPSFEPRMSEKFDTVLSCNVLEHLPRESKAISWMKYILKPHGKLILILPAHQFLFGSIDEYYGHYRRYDHSSLCQNLEKLDFKIIKSFYIGKLGAILWFFKGKVFKQGKISDNDVVLRKLLLPIAKLFEKTIKLPFGHNLITIAEKP